MNKLILQQIINSPLKQSFKHILDWIIQISSIYRDFQKLNLLFQLYDKMFVMMRHGQRGDQTFPVISSSLEYDPPMTERGKDTVIRTAQELAKIIMSNRINKIEVHSSPFLRCLMTAQVLHRSLKELLGQLKIKDTIQINNLFSQFMRPDWFETLPFKNLLINYSQSSKYIDRSKFLPDESLEGIHCPESYTQFYHRANLAKQKFTAGLADDVCKIIVTHGFIVKELCVNRILYLRFRNDIQYCEYEVSMGDKVLKYLDQPLELAKL